MRNKPCMCGSGIKFKKCCGPRGGLTQLEFDEVQAHKENQARLRRMQPRSRTPLPLMSMFGSGLPIPSGPTYPRIRNIPRA